MEQGQPLMSDDIGVSSFYPVNVSHKIGIYKGVICRVGDAQCLTMSTEPIPELVNFMLCLL